METDSNALKTNMLFFRPASRFLASYSAILPSFTAPPPFLLDSSFFPPHITFTAPPPFLLDSSSFPPHITFTASPPSRRSVRLSSSPPLYPSFSPPSSLPITSPALLNTSPVRARLLPAHRTVALQYPAVPERFVHSFRPVIVD